MYCKVKYHNTTFKLKQHIKICHNNDDLLQQYASYAQELEIP